MSIAEYTHPGLCWPSNELVPWVRLGILEHHLPPVSLLGDSTCLQMLLLGGERAPGPKRRHGPGHQTRGAWVARGLDSIVPKGAVSRRQSQQSWPRHQMQKDSEGEDAPKRHLALGPESYKAINCASPSACVPV